MSNLNKTDIQFITKNLDGIDNFGRAILDEAIGNLKVDNFPESLKDILYLLENPLFIKLMESLMTGFARGLADGYGLGFGVDDEGRSFVELDVLKVRNKMATKADQYQTLKCTNGTLVTSTSAKLKFVENIETS